MLKGWSRLGGGVSNRRVGDLGRWKEVRKVVQIDSKVV